MLACWIVNFKPESSNFNKMLNLIISYIPTYDDVYVKQDPVFAIELSKFTYC